MHATKEVWECSSSREGWWPRTDIRAGEGMEEPGRVQAAATTKILR